MREVVVNPRSRSTAARSRPPKALEKCQAKEAEQAQKTEQARAKQEPTLVSTERVAKESHLYSFLTPEGKLSTEVEGILKKIEDKARPVLQRINAGKGDLSITAYEENALATFAAFQAARLPARQRETGEMLAQMSSWLFQG